MKKIFLPLLLLSCSSMMLAQTIIKDINPGSASSQINSSEVLNSHLYFMGDNGSLGAELWTSDGTTSGTVLIKDIYLGSSHGYPAAFVEMGGELYFRADNASYGFEIWKTDGTAAGTALLKDVNSGSADGVYTSISFDIVASNNMIFMPLDEGVYGRELWVSDGTSGGTIRLLDTYVGSVSGINGAGDPKEMTPFGNGILFSSYDYDLNTSTGLGRELYRSNGTVATTAIIKDINPGIGSSNPDNFLVIGGGSTALFAADNGTDGKELWITDGTNAGTQLLADINPAGSSNPSNLVKLGSEVFFYADDGTNGKELWKTDGTTVGTVMVKDINPGSADSEVAPFSDIDNAVAFMGKLFFMANHISYGRELWVSDGTSGGTQLLKDIYPGAVSSYASYFKVAGGYLWLYANDGTNGYELWVCDGVNTLLYADINSGSASGSPNSFTQIGNLLYFVADNGNSGHELFSLDLSLVSLPLPVELLSFEADLQKDRSVQLAWTTASELNNDFFEVERSTDGHNFTTIMRVEGSGKSEEKTFYQTVDPFPLNGQNIYRLRQVDLDGTSAYSHLVMVKNIGVEPGISLYPNPVMDRFQLQLSPSGGSRQIDLLNMQAQHIERRQLPPNATSLDWDISALPAGMYILQIGGEELKTFRFVKH